MQGELQTTFNPIQAGEHVPWTGGMRGGTAPPAVQAANQLLGVTPNTYRLNMLRGTIPP